MFRYICITIRVHVLIKAGGLGCTGWGGGANTPHVTFEYFYVKVVVFFYTYIAIKRALRMQIYVYVQQLLFQIKFLLIELKEFTE